MKENGMLDKNAKFMSSRQLGEYLKTTEFDKEKADMLSSFLTDKKARQGDYVAYMRTAQGRAR